MSARRPARGAWDRFWFEPVSPEPLALFRIAFGLVVLAYAALIGPDIDVWFGSSGLLSRETARAWGGEGLLRLLDLLPPGDGWLRAFFWAWTGAVACLTLGLFTRASAVAVFLGLVSLHHRNPLILNSGDTLMRIISFHMLFAPAGAALSLDRLRRREAGRPRDVEPWPLRLIQIQLCVMYLSSFVVKIQGDPWVDGTAVYYATRLQEFWRFPVPYLFEHLWVLNLLTWGTLAVELAFPILVWVPRLRLPVLAAGALFHLGLEYAMNIPIFQWTVLATYVSFLTQDDLNRVLKRPVSVAK